MVVDNHALSPQPPIGEWIMTLCANDIDIVKNIVHTTIIHLRTRFSGPLRSNNLGNYNTVSRVCKSMVTSHSDNHVIYSN